MQLPPGVITEEEYNALPEGVITEEQYQAAPDDSTTFSTPDEGSALEAAAVAAARGATFDFADEGYAFSSAVAKKASGDERSFQDIYKDESTKAKEYMKTLEEQSPVATFAGQLAGGLLVPGLGAAKGLKTAATFGDKVIKAGKLGAQAGALYGAGQSEFNPLSSMQDAGNFAEDVGSGALTGLATGVVAQGAGSALASTGKALKGTRFIEDVADAFNLTKAGKDIDSTGAGEKFAAKQLENIDDLLEYMQGVRKEAGGAIGNIRKRLADSGIKLDLSQPLSNIQLSLEDAVKAGGLTKRESQSVLSLIKDARSIVPTETLSVRAKPVTSLSPEQKATESLKAKVAETIPKVDKEAAQLADDLANITKSRDQLLEDLKNVSSAVAQDPGNPNLKKQMMNTYKAFTKANKELEKTSSKLRYTSERGSELATMAPKLESGELPQTMNLAGVPVKVADSGSEVFTKAASKKSPAEFTPIEYMKFKGESAPVDNIRVDKAEDLVQLLKAVVSNNADEKARVAAKFNLPSIPNIVDENIKQSIRQTIGDIQSKSKASVSTSALKEGYGQLSKVMSLVDDVQQRVGMTEPSMGSLDARAQEKVYADMQRRLQDLAAPERDVAARTEKLIFDPLKQAAKESVLNPAGETPLMKIQPSYLRQPGQQAKPGEASKMVNLESILKEAKETARLRELNANLRGESALTADVRTGFLGPRAIALKGSVAAAKVAKGAEDILKNAGNKIAEASPEELQRLTQLAMSKGSTVYAKTLGKLVDAPDAKKRAVIFSLMQQPAFRKMLQDEPEYTIPVDQTQE